MLGNSFSNSLNPAGKNEFTYKFHNSHTPNAYTQKLLSDLVNNEKNSPLDALREGYNLCILTKKRKYKSSDDLSKSSQTSESLHSIEQSGLGEMVERQRKTP